MDPSQWLLLSVIVVLLGIAITVPIPPELGPSLERRKKGRCLTVRPRCDKCGQVLPNRIRDKQHEHS